MSIGWFFNGDDADSPETIVKHFEARDTLGDVVGFEVYLGDIMATSYKWVFGLYIIPIREGGKNISTGDNVCINFHDKERERDYFAEEFYNWVKGNRDYYVKAYRRRADKVNPKEWNTTKEPVSFPIEPNIKYIRT